MIAEHVIAFDTDWASDAVVAEVTRRLIEAKVKSTWFITHDSPEFRKLLEMPELFEVGIHPNFGVDSTHGKTPREIVEHLLRFAPNTKSVRTHNLIQSTPLLNLMRQEFGILYDTSLLLPCAPHLVPHDLHIGAPPITRFPSFWEDDVEMATPDQSFSMAHPKYQVPGLKLFAFHPIHVALNSRQPDDYLRPRQALSLGKASLADIDPFVNKTREGTATFLDELIEVIKRGPFPAGVTVAELGAQWRNQS